MALVALFYGRLRRARASLKAKVEVVKVALRAAYGIYFLVIEPFHLSTLTRAFYHNE